MASAEPSRRHTAGTGFRARELLRETLQGPSRISHQRAAAEKRVDSQLHIAEVERISKLERSADRELTRRQARKKRRPTGGRVVHLWVNTQEQAELAKLAERERVSLNVAAKRMLRQALSAVSDDR